VSPWQAAKLQRIAEGEFSAQFALSLALKDVRLALQAADDDRLVTLACLADEWQQAVDEGLGDQDLTVAARVLEQQEGRYHPAVVAQKAATMQLLSEGRFTLGLGAGENLNEHIVGGRWPLASVRQQMLAEAVEIIRALWAGGTVTYRGRHFDVESARVWDLPETAPPIGIAVSGPEGCRLAGQHADAMIATEPRSELGQLFDDAGGSGKPRIGQIALSYDPDEQAAVRRAMEQFRWFTGGWRVNAELPVPASFEMASRTVREEDVAAQMPCGPDLGRHLAGIRQFEAAGFTHVALVQVGADTQQEFISWAATKLLPALRAS